MPQHTMNLLGELKLQFKNKPDYVVFGEFYDRLGHANTSTTHDIYSQLYPNAEDEAITKIEVDFKLANVVKISNFITNRITKIRSLLPQWF